MTEIKQTTTYKKWEQQLKDKKVRAVIASRIFRLANDLPGDTKYVGDQVYELRIHLGPGFRIYFTRKEGRLILLLCGGDKSSQKKDIQIAKRLIKEVSDND